MAYFDGVLQWFLRASMLENRPTARRFVQAYPGIWRGVSGGIALVFSASLFTAPPSLAQQGGPPVVKVSAPVVQRIFDWDEYTGRFIPVKSVALKARISGYLNTVNFEEGEIVQQGQLLFQIDPRPYEAELASARAQLAAAEARRDVARTNAERALTLFRRDVGSEQEFQQARGTYAETVANIAVAEAAIRIAELNVEFTRILAPITGRISATEIDPGNLVTGGANGASVLATIISLDPIEFTFTASEANYLRYRRLARNNGSATARTAETPVNVKLMDEDTWDRAGRMTFLDSQIDPNSGTIEGRATFENNDLFLTPGVFGRLRLRASGAYDAVLVPDEAIVSDQSRKLVYVLDGENIARERPVVLGPVRYGLRVVREGLDGTDRVVVSGIQRVRPGNPVQPEETAVTLSSAREN